MDGISSAAGLSTSHPAIDPDDIPDMKPYPSGPGADSSTPHLKNFGGKILSNPSFFSVFLGKFWKSPTGRALQDKVTTFADVLFYSKHMDVWKQYGVKDAHFLGSSSIANTTQPKTISDAQIQTRLWTDLQAGKLPKADGNTVYTVYLPPGTILNAPGGGTSEEGIGGYHSSFDLRDGGRVYYAVIVYSEGQNGANISGKPLDNVTITSSHEWAEAATDPDVNNGRLGWYDRTYGEVGDIPIRIANSRDDIFDMVNGYAVQKDWSNRDKRAEIVPQ